LENNKERIKQSIESEFFSHALRLGEYVVDFSSGELVKPDASRLTIPRKPLRILEILILNRAREISGIELHAIASGKTETVDATTRQHIKKLRGIFDDAKMEKITTGSRGYRLALPVSSDIAESLEDKHLHNIKSHNDHSVIKNGSNSYRLKFKPSQIFSVVVLFIIIGFLFSLLNESKDSNTSSQFNLSNTPYKPLTYLDGVEFYPAASPDGKWLAFNHLGQNSDNWKIYLKDMETEELFPLTDGKSSDKYPKWSLDGKHITYTKLAQNKCDFIDSEFDIVEKRLIGQSVMKTCKPESLGAQAMLWKNNKGMFYVEESSYASAAVVYSFAFDSKASWQVTSPAPTSKGDYFIQLSHSGDKLAVLRSINDSAVAIWIYDTKTWENRLVDTVNYLIFRVNWSGNDESLIYKNDKNQIIKTNINDKTQEVIAEIKLPFYSPVLLANTETPLAIIAGEPYSSQIYKKHLGTQEEEILISSSFKEKFPSISKDGKDLAWISTRGGLPQVWFKKYNKAEIKLTELECYTDFSSLTFSPDGKMLGGTADGHYFIYDLSRNKLFWSKNMISYYVNLEWRANSDQIFITENKDGYRAILVVDIFSNKKEAFNQLSNAYLIKESLDGRFLYSWDIDTKQISRYDSKTNKTHTFEIKTDLIRTNQWSISEKGLYLSRQNTQYNELIYIEHFSNTPQVLNKNFHSRVISVPAHGEWLVFSQGAPGNTELVAL
jgi:Tol biopolymer transport system component/DNA-binding winged helix-turn-helix (wHTH) protein